MKIKKISKLVASSIAVSVCMFPNLQNLHAIGVVPGGLGSSIYTCPLFVGGAIPSHTGSGTVSTYTSTHKLLYIDHYTNSHILYFRDTFSTTSGKLLYRDKYATAGYRLSRDTYTTAGKLLNRDTFTTTGYKLYRDTYATAGYRLSRVTYNTRGVAISTVKYDSKGHIIPSATDKRNKIVAEARYIVSQSVPYVSNGTTMAGFDCSGFVQYVYAKNGYTVGRSTYDQIKHGASVSENDLLPGDLVFFENGGHVAIYEGKGWVIHAPDVGQDVKEQKLSELAANTGGFYAARRIIQ